VWRQHNEVRALAAINSRHKSNFALIHEMLLSRDFRAMMAIGRGVVLLASTPLVLAEFILEDSDYL